MSANGTAGRERRGGNFIPRQDKSLPNGQSYGLHNELECYCGDTVRGELGDAPIT